MAAGDERHRVDSRLREAWAVLSFLIPIVLTVTSAVGQTVPSEPELPRVTRLELDVRVDYETERIRGTATLTVENSAAGPTSRVPLLLNRLMQVTGARVVGGPDLTFNQGIASFEDIGKYQVNVVEIDLAAPLPKGDSLRVTVQYEGYLVGYTEVGMSYVRDHINRDFTILREDALAFPVVGVPSLRINRAFPRAPFEFEVRVTVPEDLVVATGGEPLGRTTGDGLATWHYRSREPAPYLIIAIAPYRVAQADGLRVFHFPEDEEGASRLLEASLQAAGRYQDIFGPLRRPLALNIMEIPDGWGSQANLAGGIIQEGGAFRDRSRMWELYHELSHLWNVSDLDAPSPRWNEGLATFMQRRLSRELDGWDGAAAAWERTAERLLERCGEDRPCGQVPMRRYGEKQLTDYSYSVGGLMFAALYRVLGEESFDRALRHHFQAHADTGGRTDDLVRIFVESGGPSAQRVFDDWLESTAWLLRLRAAGSAQAVFEAYLR